MRLNCPSKLRPHPNCVTVLGVCVDPKFPLCIVSEYIDGGTLNNWIHEKNFSVSLGIQMLRDIAGGMSHLHADDIIHCDLATRNLLVSSGNPPIVKVTFRVLCLSLPSRKITDFGLAKTIEENGSYYVTSGTKVPVRWSAPGTVILDNKIIV